MNKKPLKWVTPILYSAVIGLFCYAGISKILSVTAFQIKLLKISYLPVGWIPALTFSVPIVELAAVLLCMIPRLEALGWMVLYVLLMAFTCHLIIIQFFLPGVPCSCGGILESLTITQHIALNAFLITISGYKVSKLKRITA